MYVHVGRVVTITAQFNGSHMCHAALCRVGFFSFFPDENENENGGNECISTICAFLSVCCDLSGGRAAGRGGHGWGRRMLCMSSFAFVEFVGALCEGER